MPLTNIQNADGSFTASAPGTQGLPAQSYSATGSTPPPQNPSTTFDAGALSYPQQPPNFPVAPNAVSSAATAMSHNVAIPNPTVQSAADIVKQDTTTTPAQEQQTGILGKIASIMKGNTSLATLQTQQENQAGIPQLTKTVNDLNTQLQGLNDQATALANQEQYTVPNQMQENILKNGNITTEAGLQPHTAAAARQLQIQQGAIATQALTLKSAIYAAQGNLTLAKNAADRAAQVAFDQTQQEISYQKALLDQLSPTLNKDEKAQAAIQQADLADRQAQVNLGIENFKTGQAAIADALKNNPNDPEAHFAAQEAMKIDPHDPQYLQKVQQLVGKYATDLTARALDQQLKKAQIANLATSRQDTLEQQYRTALEKQFSARSGSLGVQSQKVDQAIHLRTLLDQYKDANGNYNVPPAQYAELAQGMASLLSGNNTLSDSRVADIQQRSAQGDLGKLMTYITGTNYSGSTNQILKNLSDSIDRQGKVAEQLRNQYVGGLKGLKPTSLDDARASAITQEYLPSYEDAMAGKYGGGGSQGNTTVMTGPDGKQYNVPNDKVAAFKAAGGH